MPTATISFSTTFAGVGNAAYESMLLAMASTKVSGAAATKALTKSISSAAGIDEETVVIDVAELVEGSFNFDFGEAFTSVATAYEDPSTRSTLDHALQVAVASGLPSVSASDVTRLKASFPRQLSSANPLPSARSSTAPEVRRLASLEVLYAIQVQLGNGADTSAQVTTIDTVKVATSAARGFEKAAEENPALADLAGVALMLATPEPPRVVVVVEYEVTQTGIYSKFRREHHRQ